MKNYQANKPKDQTEFRQQTPAFNTEGESWWDEAKTRIQPEKKFFQTKKGKLILGSGIFLLVLIVVLGIVLIARPAMEEGNTNSGEDEETNVAELTPLQQQIIDLRKQLKAADPAIKDTPFPQVDLEMRIN